MALTAGECLDNIEHSDAALMVFEIAIVNRIGKS